MAERHSHGTQTHDRHITTPGSVERHGHRDEAWRPIRNGGAEPAPYTWREDELRRDAEVAELVAAIQAEARTRATRGSA